MLVNACIADTCSLRKSYSPYRSHDTSQASVKFRATPWLKKHSDNQTTNWVCVVTKWRFYCLVATDYHWNGNLKDPRFGSEHRGSISAVSTECAAPITTLRTDGLHSGGTKELEQASLF